MPRPAPLPLFAELEPAFAGPPLLLVREAGGSRALGRASDYVAAAVAHGWPAIVAANVGTLAGSLDLYVAARAAGLQAVLGLEVPLRVGEDAYSGRKREPIAPTPLLLLARDAEGWRSLLRLAAMAATPGWAADLELLRRNPGLSVVSLGLAQAVLAGRDKLAALARTLAATQQAVGSTHLYAAIPHSHTEQAGARAQKQAAELGIASVALQEARYASEDEAEAYAALCTLYQQPPPEAAYHIGPPSEAARAFDGLDSLRAVAELLQAHTADLWQPPALLGTPPPTSPRTPGTGPVEEQAVAVEAAGLLPTYTLVAEITAGLRERGLICRLVPGQGADLFAASIGATNLPAALLTAGGRLKASLCLEYASTSEASLLTYVAERWPQAILVQATARTTLRQALREAAKVRGSEGELTTLLQWAASSEPKGGDLSPAAAATLALAERLGGRPRWGEASSRSLLIPAASPPLPLPLHAESPLASLTIERATAVALGAVLLDLQPNPRLDLVQQVATGEIDPQDAATWRLIAAGEAERLDGWNAPLAPTADWPTLLAALASPDAPADHPATAALAWDSYCLAWGKAHDLAAYYAAAGPTLGLHPLAQHREQWQAAFADGRLAGGPLAASERPMRLFGVLRQPRRLLANDGSTLLTAWLDDWQGSSRVFGFGPLVERIVALSEGQPALLLGRAVAGKDGEVSLLVEDAAPFSGTVPPLPAVVQTVRQARVAAPTGDFFAAVPEQHPPEPPAPSTPAVSKVTTPTKATAANDRGSKEKAKLAPPPPPLVTLRRLHLRLPVSDDQAEDIGVAQQVADLARQHPGRDLLLLYIQWSSQDVCIEPYGFGVAADEFSGAVAASLGQGIIFAADTVERPAPA